MIECNWVVQLDGGSFPIRIDTSRYCSMKKNTKDLGPFRPAAKWTRSLTMATVEPPCPTLAGR